MVPLSLSLSFILSLPLHPFYTHTHPESTIFLLIYWYSFFYIHFIMANPEYCVIMLIHSYCIAQKKRGFGYCWSSSCCQWVDNSLNLETEQWEIHSRFADMMWCNDTVDDDKIMTMTVMMFINGESIETKSLVYWTNHFVYWIYRTNIAMRLVNRFF